MHTTLHSGTVVGIDGLVVEVEIDISRGIPSFSIVGLPNTAVRESRERVTAAIKNSGRDFPLERITVNLAPADVPKEGSAFDLAIAVGILAASGQAAPPSGAPPALLLGELALDGSLRRVRGVLPAVLHARERGFERAIVPAGNFDETRVVAGVEVCACATLADAVAVVTSGPEAAAGARIKPKNEAAAPSEGRARTGSALDMADVRGQESAKRALLVAAAGGHHVIMVGPPGAGKTMLARRFPSLLPPLDDRAAIETTMIYSIVGLLNGRGVIDTGPFRSPHHSASDAGLVGGGAGPRPGEVTLAHNGVLFLDELPEFRRNVLETLREPLEEGRITISRAKTSVTFPARFQLIAAMNPCPCGYLGSRDYQCRCSPLQVEKYLAKLSGPLLDRISIHIPVQPVEVESLRGGNGGEPSRAFRVRAGAAREIQRRRCAGLDLDGAPPVNAMLPESAFASACPLEREAEELLSRAHRQLRLSARGRSHTIRVARTIADLEEAEVISAHHVAEAIQYRARRLG